MTRMFMIWSSPLYIHRNATLCYADYVDKLLTLLFSKVVHDPAEYQKLVDEYDVPPSLCSSFQRPDQAEAVAALVSRFSHREPAEVTGGSSVTGRPS